MEIHSPESLSSSTLASRRLPRSRDGCSTCRQRKVRCDERRPVCSPCERLQRECDWERQYTFKSWNRQMSRTHPHIQAATSPSWSRIRTLDKFSEQQDTNSHRKDQPHSALEPESANTFPFLNLTPDNFPRCSSPDQLDALYMDRVRWDSIVDLRNEGRDGIPDFQEAVVLPKAKAHARTHGKGSETGSSSEGAMIQIRAQGTKRVTRHVVQPSGVPLSLPIPRMENYTSIIKSYLAYTKPAFLPLGNQLSLLKDSHGDDTLVAHARSWPPLRHALCALTTLHIALKRQPDLLTSAFEHYHRALESSRDAGRSPSPTERLFLHFILLLYDVSCTDELRSPGPAPWMLHIDCIARLLKEHEELMHISGGARAFIIEYIVYLDAQSCLAGVPGSGACVAAFLASGPSRQHNSTWIPANRQIQTTTNDVEKSAFSGVARLSGAIAVRFTELAHLSTRCRDSITPINRGLYRQDILDLQAEIKRTWRTTYPEGLPLQPLLATSLLPPFTRTLLSFAIMQYSTAMLYLHTSMGSQRDQRTDQAAQEIAFFCTLILRVARSAAERGIPANHHLVFPIFLAGINTDSIEERSVAWDLLKVFEETGIGRSATRTREFFERIIARNENNFFDGQTGHYAQWITLAKRDGLILVNMGL